MNGYNRLEWGNTCDLDITLYQQGFKQWMYIDCDPSLPEYNLESDEVTGGKSETLRTFARLDKRLQMQFVAPEFLLDAITLIPLHDSVFLYTKDGETWRLTEVVNEIEWLEGDCLAVCTMSFLADRVDALNCCDNFARCLELTLGDVVDCVDITDAIYTDPVGEGIEAQSVYFFFTSGDASNYVGDVYQLQLGEWVLIPAVEGDIFNNETTGVNYYFNGSNWLAYPRITSIDDALFPNIVIYGYLPNDTWAMLQENYAGAGWSDVAIYTALEFQNGIPYTVTEPVDVQFRALNYTHSCNYGYTNTDIIQQRCLAEIVKNYDLEDGPLGVPDTIENWTAAGFTVVQSVDPLINYQASGAFVCSLKQSVWLSDQYTYTFEFQYRIFSGNAKWKFSDGAAWLNDDTTWSIADTFNALPGPTALTTFTITIQPPNIGYYEFDLYNDAGGAFSIYMNYLSIQRDCS